MAKDEKKKSIFDKAIDALTNRDEKAAAVEKAAADKAAEAKATADRVAKEAEARRKAAEATRDQMAAKVASDKAEKEAEAKAAKEDAQKKMAETQARIKKEQERLGEAAKIRAAEFAAAAKPKFIAEYTIAPNDTLSHVALKYYGNASREYWTLIYEANKEAIGDNPGMVRAGTVLQIPELPEELKKK